MNICLLRSLWCSILRLISLSASGERHYKLLAYGVVRSFQNALVESKIPHVLQTLLCDVTNGRPSVLPLRKCNGPLRELKAM